MIVSHIDKHVSTGCRSIAFEELIHLHRDMFVYMADYHEINTRSTMKDELLVPRVNLTMAHVTSDILDHKSLVEYLRTSDHSRNLNCSKIKSICTNSNDGVQALSSLANTCMGNLGLLEPAKMANNHFLFIHHLSISFIHYMHRYP